MHKTMSTTLFVITLTLTSNLAAVGEVSRLNDKCQVQPARDNQEGWATRRSYQFLAQGQSYKLIYSAAQDGTGALCLSQGNTFQPLATKYWYGEYIDRLDRVQGSIFTFQVHQGNGNNVPVKKYRLDLSNPRQPKVKLLKQWME